MIIDTIPLGGGVDSVTTPILVKPGKLLSSINFEPDINGGYKRMPGFERYDGQTSPSNASYYMVACTVTGTVSAGDTITGVTSGATAVVLLVVSSSSLVVTKVTGTFVSESFTVSAVTQGSLTAVTQNSATTGALHATYKNLAADSYRSDIAKPPGSGAVRGVWHYNGEEYAFRDNAGATECVMYKATTSGWTAITFGREIQFTTATGQISEGDTIVGGTSAATGVVKRALLRTGTWTSAGVGTLVLDAITGTFTNGENIKVGGVNKVVANGGDTAITLNPGGRFEFDNVNFTGSTDTLRMYCADGVNYAGEFDGTRWAPIRTGIGSDFPKYIKGHKNHLFIAIESSIQISSIGAPYTWTALTGASELSLGATCTGILPQVGDSSTGVLVATTANKVFILYGNSSSDWNLVTHSPDSGSTAYTLQNIGFAHFLDTKGITQLQASQAFGGFSLSLMSQEVQNFINEKRGLQKSSCIVRSSNQYRVFYSDGTGLIMQVSPAAGGTKSSALMPFDYGATVYMNTVCSFVDTDGTERVIASGSDGYVYELNKGTSFDGAAIPYHFMMVYTHSKSPRVRKRYRRTVLQFRAGNTATVNIGYDLSYGNIDPSYANSAAMSQVIAKSVNGAGGYWDNFNWDSFTWDASYMQEINVSTPGIGESIAILLTGETDEDEPFTVHTCYLHYLPGRQNR